jgi:hypothetical protein
MDFLSFEAVPLIELPSVEIYTVRLQPDMADETELLGEGERIFTRVSLLGKTVLAVLLHGVIPS